jgi:hypothetical protein
MHLRKPKERRREMESLINEYTAVVGVILPLLVAYLKNQDWPKGIKMALAVLLTVVASVGHMFYSGNFDMADLGKTFLVMLSISTTTYKWVWQPTKVSDKIETRMGVGKS